MLNVAVLPESVPVPMVVVPSRKATVPVGVPAREVTVAVKVSNCPNTEESADAVTTVLLAACVTLWLMAAEVLPPKLPLPA